MSEAVVGTTPPAPTLLDQLRDRLKSTPVPLTAKELGQALTKPKKVKAAEFVASLPGYLEEDLRSGQAFKYASGSKGAERFWGRDERQAIREAVLAAADEPKKLADLKKVAKEAAKSDKKFADALVDEMVAGGELHAHGTGKSAAFGRKKPEPPHPYEKGQGKKDFDKLVKAARALLESVKDVPPAGLLERLRVELGKAPPEPKAKKNEPAATASGPAPSPAAPATTPERTRTELKAAYDELCLHPEFEDRLVEIRRLYHDAKRRLPDLTVEQFHRELEHLQAQRVLELHALNEVQRAKEPELALLRNDRLLYFVIWSK